MQFLLFDKFNRKFVTFLFVAGILWTISPIILIAIANYIADSCGCDLSLQTVQPCYLWGYEISGLLGMMAFSGYFLVLTIPSGLLWLFILIVLLVFKVNSSNSYE